MAYKALIIVLGLTTNIHQDDDVWKEALRVAVATSTSCVPNTFPESLRRGDTWGRTSKDGERILFLIPPLVSWVLLHQAVELSMCALSNRIREEPVWWEKMENEETVERWREEALNQAENDELEQTWKLTPGMVFVSPPTLGPFPSS